MKKTIFLMLCLILLLCGCTPSAAQEASNPSKGQEETTHDTIIYVWTPIELKADVVELLDSIGYWKD